jgi:hypothetical protein
VWPITKQRHNCKRCKKGACDCHEQAQSKREPVSAKSQVELWNETKQTADEQPRSSIQQSRNQPRWSEKQYQTDNANQHSNRKSESVVSKSHGEMLPNEKS